MRRRDTWKLAYRLHGFYLRLDKHFDKESYMSDNKPTTYRAHGSYVYSTGSTPIARCEADGTHSWQTAEETAKLFADALNAAQPEELPGRDLTSPIAIDDLEGWRGRAADLRLFLGRAERALRELRADAQDRPWEGSGPTLEEAGSESILFRCGSLLWPACWEEGADGWIDLSTGQLAETQAPKGWRRMPKV